ncbi:SIS domain-containing protein [Dongia deserti]|uniref:SIS domain-containing protein n=1 Tax=Dongia deserti TaxID=2268030 RepID=UPI0025491EE5|nr:SIS domain-containing protein [Dongia deserti]
MNAANSASWMARETAESGDAVARLLDQSGNAIRAAGKLLRDLDPRLVAICARGSSNHAAAFFKYATETQIGLPVVPIGPSIASVYQTPLRLSGTAMLLISQSGRSPDLLAMAKAAQQGGAKIIAFVNDAASPAAEVADLTIPLQAGPEKSVAATKSCIASMAAGLALLADWSRDGVLNSALAELPGALRAAVAADWSEMVAPLVATRSALIIGRGVGYPIAMEAALKLKETASLHAEPYSAAEVLHGPIQIVQKGFPVLLFRQRDAAGDSLDHCAARLANAGAQVFVAGAANGSAKDFTHLPVASSNHPATELISAMVSCYATVDRIARARGFDPDTPPLLKKVTETL